MKSQINSRFQLASSCIALGLALAVGSCAKLTQTHTVGPSAKIPETTQNKPTPPPSGRTAPEPEKPEDPIPGKPPVPTETERLLTFVGTNDIHGSVEPYPEKDGGKIGGMEVWYQVLSAMRAGHKAQYGDRAAVEAVDAGDQFQGTLLSNFDEGKLVFSLMNLLGYSAAVPGNHDYDFGPVDWCRDKVTDTIDDFKDLPGGGCRPMNPPDMNPRGSIEALAKIKKFSLLSANTFILRGMVDTDGNTIPDNEVSQTGCISKHGADIDFEKAKRPAFLDAYLIKEVAGVRVAYIGLDFPTTHLVTTADNVTDLCFRDPTRSYIETQAGLKDKADVFVLVIHDGNAQNDFHVSKMIAALEATPGVQIDVVFAGHTHQSNQKLSPKGVPMLQSRSDGKYFGRIDLIWDTVAKKVVKSKTWAAGSIALSHQSCDPRAKDFCVVQKTGTTTKVLYEGVAIQPQDPHSPVAQLIAEARKDISPISDLPLGEAKATIKRAREVENALSNRFSDAFREITGADVTIINGGGIRADLSPGPVTYETLFRMVPFNNRAVRLGPVTAQQLVDLFDISAKSCGIHGSLFQSGLRIEYSRDCRKAVNQKDQSARTEKIATVTGEVIFDRQLPKPFSDRTFILATLDFLSNGGSGYTPFLTLPRAQNFDIGVLREVLRRQWSKTPFTWVDGIDGRFKNRTVGGDPQSAPTATTATAESAAPFHDRHEERQALPADWSPVK